MQMIECLLEKIQRTFNVQRKLDLYTTAFAQIASKINAANTKTLIMNGVKIPPPSSMTSQERMVTVLGETFPKNRKYQTTIWELSGTQLPSGALQIHYTTNKSKNGRKNPGQYDGINEK